MRIVIQRVSEASVTVEGSVTGAIEKGLMVLIGIEDADTDEDIAWLSSKIVNLRIFDDAEGVMNLSVKDVDGEVRLVNEEQKERIREKLANKITDEDQLLVKSQTERSQLGNKGEVTRKMNQLVNSALIRQKVRRPTKPTRAAQEKRIETKKKNRSIKELRRKINKHDYL